MKECKPAGPKAGRLGVTWVIDDGLDQSGQWWEVVGFLTCLEGELMGLGDGSTVKCGEEKQESKRAPASFS